MDTGTDTDTATDTATGTATDTATDAEILLKIVDGITDLRRDVKHLIKRMNHKRKPSADTPKAEAHIDTTQDTTQDANDSPPETPSIEHPRPRLNRTHIFNRSKFLDIGDHDRLIQYVTSQAVIDAISNAEPHKRVSLLRRLIRDNLKLSISMYMTQKLINTHMPINGPPRETAPDPDDEIDTTDF